MKIVNVGIIGLGTVGGGVVRTLLEKKTLLKNKTGLSIRLVRVFDKDSKRISRLGIPKRIVAKSAHHMVRDKDIDIVVELIGGINPAREIILSALDYGKHVVTANKAVLASFGRKIFEKAAKKGCYIGFEASVGGAMPVIKILRESFVANRIKTLYGIVNGTCNFVITSMAEQHCTLKTAIEEAKGKGIAEVNPKLDINGDDSCHKLCILTMLAFGTFVKLKDIYVEGIKNVDLQDIIYAKNWGYDLKLLAIAKKEGNSLELRVHPTLISLRHLISAVRGEDNAIFIKGDMIGESMIYGKGAGRYPAASSVISDILDISKNITVSSCARSLCINLNKKTNIKKIKGIGDLVTRYYVRFSAIDEPGVLAAISSILAKNKISIATVSQKERKKGQVVPIVMVTHYAKESLMNRALNEINRLKFIKKKTVRIRIER